MTKKYKIAGKVIEVTSIYEKVHDYCKDYETDEQADFSVITTAEDIFRKGLLKKQLFIEKSEKRYRTMIR